MGARLVREVQHRHVPRVEPAHRGPVPAPRRPDGEVRGERPQGHGHRRDTPHAAARASHTALQCRPAMRPRRGGRRIQGLGEQRRGRVAVGRDLRERAQHRTLYRVGNRAPHDRRRRHHVQRVARDDRLSGGARERRLAHQHLVHDAREAVFVAAPVDFVRASGLLGAHVRRRPEDGAGLGEVPALSRRAHRAGDTEVRHHGRAARQHDVLGLDVAVHHPVAVRVGQRARHLGGDAERVFLGQLFLARQAVAQGFPFDVRHDVIEEAGRGAGVVQRQDVGMLQPGGGLDLAQKPLGAERRGELGVEDLDRHRSVVLQVLRQKHRRHAPTTQLPLDRVAVSEGLTEGVEQIGHGMWGPSLQRATAPR